MTDGKNSRVGADELRHFVERVEKIEADEKALKADKKEIMDEAKGRGYDTKILRSLIAERRRDPDEVAEEESIRDLYRQALGMAFGQDADDDDGMV